MPVMGLLQWTLISGLVFRAIVVGAELTDRTTDHPQDNIRDYHYLASGKQQDETPPINLENVADLVKPQSLLFTKVKDFSLAQNSWFVGLLLDVQSYEPCINEGKTVLNEITAAYDQYYGGGLIKETKDHRQDAMHVNARVASNIKALINILKTNLKHLQERINVLMRMTTMKQHTWLSDLKRGHAILGSEHLMVKRSVKKMVDIIQNFNFSKFSNSSDNFLERSRRSAPLQFVGNALEAIFGLSTGQETKELRSDVDHLKAANKHILSALQDEMITINYTNLHVNQNRRKINKIIDHLYENDFRITRLRESVNDTWQFANGMVLWLYSWLFENHLKEVTAMITELEREVHAVLDYRITPTLLKPDQLVDVLKNISLQLPKELYFAYDKGEDILELYKTLSVIPLAHSRGLYVIIAISLLDARTTYTLFQTISVPTFFPHSLMTAEFDIQHKRFAVSHDLSWVIFMSDEDFLKCSQPYTKYCSMANPAYSTQSFHDDCLMDLFLRNNFSPDNCPIKFRLSKKAAEIRYITGGNWLISVAKPTMIRILCHKKPATTMLIQPSVHKLKLDKNCEGKANGFFLHMYSSGSRELAIHMPPTMKMSKFTMWKPVYLNMQEAQSKIPTKLQEICENSTTLNHLNKNIQYHLSKAKKENDQVLGSDAPKSTGHHWYFYVILTLGVILIMVILSVLFYFYCFKRKLYEAIYRRMLNQTLSETPAKNPSLELDSSYEHPIPEREDEL